MSRLPTPLGLRRLAEREQASETRQWRNATLTVAVLLAATVGAYLLTRSPWIFWSAAILLVVLTMLVAIVVDGSTAKGTAGATVSDAARRTPDARRTPAPVAPASERASVPGTPPRELPPPPAAPPPTIVLPVHRDALAALVMPDFEPLPDRTVWPDLGRIAGHLATRVALLARAKDTTPLSRKLPPTRLPNYASRKDPGDFAVGLHVAALGHRANAALVLLEAREHRRLSPAQYRTVDDAVTIAFANQCGAVLTPPHVLRHFASIAERDGGPEALEWLEETRGVLRAARSFDDARVQHAERRLHLWRRRERGSWDVALVAAVEVACDYLLYQRAVLEDVLRAERERQSDESRGDALSRIDAHDRFVFEDAIAHLVEPAFVTRALPPERLREVAADGLPAPVTLVRSDAA